MRALAHRLLNTWDRTPPSCDLACGDVAGRYALLIVVAYLLVGASFYAYAEEWEWLDALYFCVVTVTSESAHAQRRSAAAPQRRSTHAAHSAKPFYDAGAVCTGGARCRRL